VNKVWNIGKQMLGHHIKRGAYSLVPLAGLDQAARGSPWIYSHTR